MISDSVQLEIHDDKFHIELYSKLPANVQDNSDEVFPLFPNIHKD